MCGPCSLGLGTRGQRRSRTRFAGRALGESRAGRGSWPWWGPMRRWAGGPCTDTGRISQGFGQSLVMSVEIGRSQTQISAQFGPCRPNSPDLSQIWPGSGQHVDDSSRIFRFRAFAGELGPTPAKFRPKWSDAGRSRPNIGRIRTNVDRNRAVAVIEQIRRPSSRRLHTRDRTKA